MCNKLLHNMLLNKYYCMPDIQSYSNFSLVGNTTKIFYSAQSKNQEQKDVESTVKEDILFCQFENSSRCVWLQAIVDFEYAKI